MKEWLTKFTTWFVDLVKSFFEALKDFFGDFVVRVADWFFSVIVSALNALPVPSFMNSGSGGFGDLFSGLPSFSLYVIGQAGLPSALLVIGSGVAFRLARKLITLGQW